MKTYQSPELQLVEFATVNVIMAGENDTVYTDEGTPSD